MKDSNHGTGTVTANVCRIVAKSSWGKVTPAVESDPEGIPRWSLVHDQLSWSRPTVVTSQEVESVDELVDYWSYLHEVYPETGDNAEQNKKIREDRVQGFAEKGALGGKFRSTRERMLKALNLPKGAKEELNYAPSVVDKIMNGLPLWDEAEEKNDDAGEDDSKATGRLTDEQKNLLTMFGEGKYHLIPSFFRTLIFLKKQKREFAVLFRTFG